MRRRNENLETKMFLMVETWKKSEKSHRDFCIENGVSVSKFKYWQKKYRASRGSKEKSKRAEKKFVSLGLRQENIKPGSKIELQFPNGIKMFCEAEVLRELLENLIESKNV